MTMRRRRRRRRPAGAEQGWDTIGLGRRAIGRVLSSAPVRDLQEDPFRRRARRDDELLRVVACTALRRSDTAIDVGAHRGSFLELALAAAPDGRHLAFEPLPQLAAELRAAHPQAEVHQVALSDTDAETTFLHVREEPGYSGFRRGAYPARYRPEPITVRRARLDDILGDRVVPRLIKIDVEGAELEVLRGAAETLARHRPIVVFEHYAPHAEAYGTTARQLHALLAQAGLRVFDLDGRGPLDAAAMQDLADRREIWSFLARP